MKQIGLRNAHEEFKNFLKENKKSKTQTVCLPYGKDIDQLIVFLEDMKKTQSHEAVKEDIEAFWQN